MTLKILIVDDAAFIREALIQICQMAGHIVVGEAANGQEAVENASKLKPDLIIMDLSLPVLDGWAATRRIKSDATLRHIPVIALSSHAMRGDEEKARQAGCDDYLSKPLDEDLLFEKLAQLLGES